VDVSRDGRYEEGLRIRTEVLGAEYVERAISGATSFTQPLQELLTEYCWGAVWARPGIDRKTRSIINLAILTALNRPRELTAHVRGALANGCSEEEIRETLLQTAVYCGVPAAVDAFHTAQAVLEERSSETA
jgi:4-carboxymuconolactone decarboxylase